MAKQPFDTFSPTGGVDQPPFPPVLDHRSASISSLPGQPRGLPGALPSVVQAGRSGSPKPYSYAPPFSQSSSQRQASNSFHQQSFTSGQPQKGRPPSPPFGGTSSAEDSRAAQVQGWRLYTKHLRENAQGERAHMEADRARLEEVMAEERALWDQERDFLKARIDELESQVARAFGRQNFQQRLLEPDLSGSSAIAQNGHHHPQQPSSSVSPGTVPVDGNSAKVIAQESGRNPDGSPFYAPAPRNPSRTFEISQNNGLRVDNMSAPRETPLRVTSKELTKSDFGIQPAPGETTCREGSESIDISCLQPELDGVPIKTSAVAPDFVAKVLSPNSSLSPSKPSSHTESPTRRRDVSWSQDGPDRTSSNGKLSTLEVIAAPETHRLTMNAGHTPNHSLHKFELGDSGNATPTQNNHRPHDPSTVVDQPDQHLDENLDPDPELRGPLGLKNDAPKDEVFLAALTNKLREIKEGGLQPPSEGSVDKDDLQGLSESAVSNMASENKKLAAASERMEQEDSEQSVDEAPALRVKASMNFGRPFGSL